MTVPISLDLGDPPRDIYADLVNLPDPCKLGVTLRAYNYDDVGLYFKVRGVASGWTFTTTALGLIASGANLYKNIDQFGSRVKPAVECGENLSVILDAYTDAGYTTLKWTFTRTLQVYFINSADPSYTLDELDNFDDGTVQGWSAVNELNGVNVTGAVATDYVLSPAYSFRGAEGSTNVAGVCQNVQTRYRIQKTLTTPNKDIIYAIIDMRIGRAVSGGEKWFKNYVIQQDSTTLVYFGKAYDTVASDYTPVNKWIRVVVPLPKNTTLTLNIIVEHLYHRSSSGSMYAYSYIWVDDFKIISK